MIHATAVTPRTVNKHIRITYIHTCIPRTTRETLAERDPTTLPTTAAASKKLLHVPAITHVCSGWKGSLDAKVEMHEGHRLRGVYGLLP